MSTQRKTVKYSTNKNDPRDPLHGTRYRTKVGGFSEAGEPIFKCVGEGGFSQVYEAESRNLETEAVVKILKHELADDASTVERVLAEARNVAQLQHLHIVKVLDVGFTADKRAYIAMEKLQGRTLQHLLEERGRLDPFEAVVCTRQILAAMGYAHQRGIIHRDLKPDNIFLHRASEEDDSELCVKVIDFGLAKLLPQADPETKFRKLKRQTLGGVFLGTPRYAAPEQFIEELPVDQRADLYAIALVLYRMIVGSDPFDLFSAEVMGDAKTQFSAQTIVGHLKSLADSNNEPELERLAKELPKSLGGILQKALQRHPKHRYQQAKEFDAALAGIERALLAKKPFVRGQACGPYTIVNLIARGHIGDVYLAHDDELKRPVAIKTLKLMNETEHTQQTLLESLRREASILANITHRNLPTVFMAQETNGRYWIATELVAGETLRELRKGGPLAQDAVIRYAIDIASGLSAAHAQGVLHLDLKPSNVLITERGRVVVIDLGMAQALQTVDSSKIHGSSAYTAPEMLRPRGHSEATSMSDVYSLGIILYELLAEHPYQGVLDNTKELVHHHVFVEPAPLEQQRGDLSEALCRLVARCLEKEPGDRFHRMEDVVAALKTLAGLEAGYHEDAPVDDSVQVFGQRGRTLRLGTNVGHLGSNAELSHLGEQEASSIEHFGIDDAIVSNPSPNQSRTERRSAPEQSPTDSDGQRTPLHWMQWAIMLLMALAVAVVTAVLSSAAIRYVAPALPEASVSSRPAVPMPTAVAAAKALTEQPAEPAASTPPMAVASEPIDRPSGSLQAIDKTRKATTKVSRTPAKRAKVKPPAKPESSVRRRVWLETPAKPVTAAASSSHSQSPRSRSEPPASDSDKLDLLTPIVTPWSE